MPQYRACSAPFGGRIIKFAVCCLWTNLHNHKKNIEEELKGLHTHTHVHPHTHRNARTRVHTVVHLKGDALCTFTLIACFKQRLIVENYTLYVFFCAPSLSFFFSYLCLQICIHVRGPDVYKCDSRCWNFCLKFGLSCLPMLFFF